MTRQIARVLWPLLLVLGLLPGCAHTLAVQVPVTLPARVPVQVFPALWVAGGENQEEIYLLDRIAGYLARDPRREVRRVQAAELEPARQAGQISWLTAVLRLKMNFRADQRSVQSNMPMSYCGLFGCNMFAYQSYYSVVPVLHGDVVLSVYEGPTARELSQETFTESNDGDGSDDGARRAIVERLADALERAVDLATTQERFLVQESGIPDADKGVRALAQGRFHAATELLQKARAALGGYKREPQARVLHALGIALLLDAQPAPPSLRNFDDAERALTRAYQLAPSALRRAALDEVASWRKQQAALIEQQYAASHNFALAKAVAGQAGQTAPVAPAPVAPAPAAAPPTAAPSAATPAPKAP